MVNRVWSRDDMFWVHYLLFVKQHVILLLFDYKKYEWLLMNYHFNNTNWLLKTVDRKFRHLKYSNSYILYFGVEIY